METKKRTLCKVILLRIIVFILISVSTVIIFNQSIMNGIEFAILDVIIEFLTHYIYDRIWGKIKWGLIERKKEITEEKKITEEKDKDKNIVAFTI